MAAADDIRTTGGYEFSKRQIARHKCIDCGVNVIEIGDYCMIASEIWEDQFKLGWDDNMCIACAETRLGRMLKPDELEFGLTPPVKGYPKSELLLSRIRPPVPPKKQRKRRVTNGRR